MNYVDGKEIARKMRDEIKECISRMEHRPVMAVVVVGDDPVIESFVRIKKRVADEVGVVVEEHRFSGEIDTDTLVAKVEDLGMDESVQGIVVQLPLPSHVDTISVLSAMPVDKDVDVLSHEANMKYAAGALAVVPPVVGAIEAIVNEHNVKLKGKKAVVIGQGRLVGQPAGIWLRSREALVVPLSRRDVEVEKETIDADIIVLGAGCPGLLVPEMIKEGVVILDAGTSEEGGKIAGDADPACSEKASLITPVPGGIGPITVAQLFRNLCDLSQEKEGEDV